MKSDAANSEQGARDGKAERATGGGSERVKSLRERGRERARDDRDEACTKLEFCSALELPSAAKVGHHRESDVESDSARQAWRAKAFWD